MEAASVPTTASPATPAAPTSRRGSPLFAELGELVLFCLETMKALPGSLRYLSEVIRFNAVVTRRMTFLMFFMCACAGASAANFGFFLLRSLGASDFVGIIPGLLTPRLSVPQVFGYAFASSVCCAITAELGSAKIQQEIDAYRAEGVDPMEMLVGPRVLGALLFVPLAGAVGLAGVLAGSYVVIVVVLQGNSSQQMLETYFSILPLGSLLYSVITVALVTLQCVLVACFYGMRTSGGPDEVGRSVARSLGVNLVLHHIVIALAALVFYGGSLGLPIGD